MIGEHQTISRHVHCPRCGYDQRGVIATWTESCPLQGTCSECGLEFDWAPVLVSEKFEPQWCVEFVPNRWGIPLACVKTFMSSLLPWRFWSQLRMSYSLRRTRLVMYAIFLVVPFLLAYVIGATALATQWWMLISGHVRSYQQQMSAVILSTQGQIAAMKAAAKLIDRTQEEVDAHMEDLLLPQGYDATSYRYLIDNYRTTNKHQLDVIIPRFEQAIVGYQARAAVPPTMNHSYLLAVFEVVFLPLQPTSSGFILFADGSTEPYPAPFDIWNEALDFSGMGWTPGGGWISGGWAGGGGFMGGGGWIFDWRSPGMLAILNVGLALLLAMLLPLTFVLLPASRRKAKVRWAHVGRIFVYSLAMIEALVIVLVIAGLASLIWQSRFAPTILEYSIVSFVLVLPVWWAFAIHRYLKMPHAGWVAALMMLMLLLLLSPILQHIFPQGIVDLVIG